MFPNEEMAIPDEEKANPRVEIAFAAQEKQNAKEEMAIPGEEKQNARVEIAFAAQEKQNATRKWQFPMRKSKMLAWKSLLLRRKGKIRARQSSGSLRSEASQGSSTASRRATRVLDKLPRGFVFNYGELALAGFEVQSVLPLFRSRAFLRGRERKASWRNWLAANDSRSFFRDWHHNCVAALINYLRRCKIVHKAGANRTRHHRGYLSF